MSEFASGKKIVLKSKLNPGDSTFTADSNVFASTGALTGRFYFKNDTQQEWVSFTNIALSGSNYIYTVGLRSLSQTADPSTGTTGLTWLAGSEGVLTVMHDQLFDKQQNNALPYNISFTGSTNQGIKPNVLTTAQRTALSIPANESCIVYDSDLGTYYIWQGGAWSAMSSGSTQPNASTAVAGKTEIATSGETQAGTNIGGTGASLVALPSDIAANIQSGIFISGTMSGADTKIMSLTPVITAYANGIYVVTNTTVNTTNVTLNINSLGPKDVKSIDGNALIAGDMANATTYILYYNGVDFRIIGTPASSDKKGIVEMDTDAEAMTGSDNTRYINSTQLLKTRTKVILQTTRVMSMASSTVTIAHGLGYTPKAIEIRAIALSGFQLDSFGFSDGTNNYCNAFYQTNDNPGVQGVTTSASNCIYLQMGGNPGANGYRIQTATATFDSTNISLIFTYTSSNPSADTTAYITILVHQ